MIKIRNTLFAVLIIGCFTPVFAGPSGGTTSGSATYCSSTNAGVITLAGYSGTILNWQRSLNGGVSWSLVPSTVPSLTYFNVGSTTDYRAVIDVGSGVFDTSTISTVTILPPSVGGTLSGGGAFCSAAASGTLTLSGETGNVLNWESSIDNGGTWTNIANTTNTENFSGVTLTTLYRVSVQNGASCAIVYSNQITITVNPPSVGGSITGANTVCTNSSVSLTLGGYTGTIKDWVFSTDNGTSWSSTGNTLSTLTTPNLTQTVLFKAIVQNAACPVDSSTGKNITVDPIAVGGVLTGGGTFCGATASGTLTLSAYTGTISSWGSSVDNGTTWTPIANTTNTENYSALAQTTIYRAQITSGACPAQSSTMDTVFVSPQTVPGAVTADATVCPLISADTLYLNGQVGDVLKWQNSTDGTTWNDISNTSDKYYYSNIAITTQFRAVVQNGNCMVDYATSANITVLALPTVFAGTDTIIDEGVTVVLNGSGTGVPTWSPALSLDDETIFTPTASPLATTTYTLTVVDGNNCENTDDVMVTVRDTFPDLTTLSIVNLFTPNGDGFNDYWTVAGIGAFTLNEVFIYNVNGQLVYSKKDYLNDWDDTYEGVQLPEGTYYFIITAENLERPLKGSLDILR